MAIASEESEQRIPSLIGLAVQRFMRSGIVWAHTSALISALALGGCMWVTNAQILEPADVPGWKWTPSAAYTEQPPYAKFEREGIFVSVSSAKLHELTMAGPLFVPVIPVPETPDRVYVGFDVKTEGKPVIVDPRQITLVAPCGPGTKADGNSFARELKATLWDMHEGPIMHRDTPVTSYPVTVPPKYLLGVAIIIDANPDVIQECTLHFGDGTIAADGPIPLADLPMRRGKFHSAGSD